MTAGHSTPGHSSPEHLTPDELADHGEGLLAPAEAAAADRHLAACAPCRDTVAALREVGAALAADDPGPMPELVARRLDRAIGAAARERSADADAPLQRRGRTDVERRRLRTRVGGGLLAVAAAGAVALVVPSLVDLSSGGSTPSAGGAAAPASADSAGGSDGGAESSGGGEPAPQAAQEGGLSRTAKLSVGRQLQSLAADAGRVEQDTGAAAYRSSVAGCRLTAVRDVPGRVVTVDEEQVGSRTVLLVALQRAAGQGTAVAIDRCAADATVLARADSR